MLYDDGVFAGPRAAPRLFSTWRDTFYHSAARAERRRATATPSENFKSTESRLLPRRHKGIREGDSLGNANGQVTYARTQVIRARLSARPVLSLEEEKRSRVHTHTRVLLQRRPLYQILIVAIIPSAREILFVYLGNSRPALISISGKSAGRCAAYRDPPNRYQFLNRPRPSPRHRHAIATPYRATSRHAPSRRSGISCSRFLLLQTRARHRTLERYTLSILSLSAHTVCP